MNTLTPLGLVALPLSVGATTPAAAAGALAYSSTLLSTLQFSGSSWQALSAASGVDLTSAQTIGGIKTFSSPPVFSGASITAGTLAPTALSTAAVLVSGAQTVAGVKTFSSPPVLSGASITAASIPNSALVSGGSSGGGSTAMYSSDGTSQTQKDVVGRATLTLLKGSGSAAIALSGAAAFTSASTYGLGSAPTIVGGTSSLAPGGIGIINTGSSPRAVAIDTSGNIYVANQGSNTVTKYAPAGGTATLTISTGSSPYAIALDASGNIYVVNQGSNTVTKYAPAGGAATLTISTGSSPYAIALDASGNIYVSNYNSNTVTKYAPAGGAATLTISTGSSPGAIALDSSGNIYVANYSSNTVGVYTSAGLLNLSIIGVTALSASVNPVFSVIPSSGSNLLLLCAVEGAGTTADGILVVAYDLRGY